MNEKQIEALEKLRLLLSENGPNQLSDSGENDGFVFTELDGVTVIIGPVGTYIVPAVRSYDEGIETAENAANLWRKQARRDSRDPIKARGFKTGHLNSLIDTAWKCTGKTACPCASEDVRTRRYRSLGRTK